MTKTKLLYAGKGQLFVKPLTDEQTSNWFIFLFKDLVLISGQNTACTNDFDFVLSFSVLLKTQLTIFEIVKRLKSGKPTLKNAKMVQSQACKT